MGKLIENLLLSDIHSGGKAVGQYNGKNIFVPLGIPGETVDVVLDRRQRGFYSGAIELIKEQAANRVHPFCLHHGVCGGCNWQHMSYPAQLYFKKRILENALKKYKIETPPIPDVIASKEIHYFRNKVEYSFASVSQNGSANCLGFHPLETRHEIIDITDCRLQREPSRKIFKAAREIAVGCEIPFYHYPDRTGLIRNIVIRTSTTGETLVIAGFTADDKEKITTFLRQLKSEVPEISSLIYTVLTNPEMGYMDGELIPFHGDKFLTEKIGNLTYIISPRAFFQPNPQQAFHIYEKILEYAGPANSGLMYDLYTGAGTIACYLASKTRKVIGIDGSADAIRDAGINAEINKLSNTEFICGDVLKTFNPEFVSSHGRPDIIILDPPRSGTLIEIKKTITGASPAKIIYVSCNPVSLAFDLTMLTNGYRVTQVQPFDMFPHTHHVETVVLLEKE
jgi:23S rRNA (uracil1939-C5)-methyltransferase